eukprot:403330837
MGNKCCAPAENSKNRVHVFNPDHNPNMYPHHNSGTLLHQGQLIQAYQTKQGYQNSQLHQETNQLIQSLIHDQQQQLQHQQLQQNLSGSLVYNNLNQINQADHPMISSQQILLSSLMTEQQSYPEINYIRGAGHSLSPPEATSVKQNQGAVATPGLPPPSPNFLGHVKNQSADFNMKKLQHVKTRQPSYENINSLQSNGGANSNRNPTNTGGSLTNNNSNNSKKNLSSSGQIGGPQGGLQHNHTSINILEAENGDNVDRLEVPKLKPSPTIRISKEWMGQDNDDQLVESPINLYKRERTLGSKKRPSQNIEFNITISQQIIDSPVKINQQNQRAVLMRKQSTIHQIKKRLKQRKAGQSPNGSEFSADYWNRNGKNDSDVFSQNSMNSQSVSIQQKNKQIQMLDQLLLGTTSSAGQQIQQKRNSNGTLDDLLNNSDQNMKRHMGNKKSLNQQTLGITLNTLNGAGSNAGGGASSSTDGNNWFHSSTPQFQAESFMRGTSRSSGADDGLLGGLLVKQDKGEHFDLIHNLVDDLPYNQNFGNQNYGGNSNGPVPMFGMQLKPNLISRDDEFSRRDVEIVEDDNESQASSFAEGRNTTLYQKRKMSSKNQTSNLNKSSQMDLKINVENVDKDDIHEDDQDSFKSSLSMLDDDENQDENKISGTDKSNSQSKLNKQKSKENYLQTKLTNKNLAPIKSHSHFKIANSPDIRMIDNPSIADKFKYQNSMQTVITSMQKQASQQLNKDKEQHILQFVNQVTRTSKQSNNQFLANQSVIYDQNETQHQLNQSQDWMNNQSAIINQSLQKITLEIPNVNPNQTLTKPPLNIGHQLSLAHKLQPGQQKNLISMIRQQRTTVNSRENSQSKEQQNPQDLNNQTLSTKDTVNITSKQDTLQLRQQSTIITTSNQTFTEMRRLLTPLRSLSKQVSDDESLAQIKSIIQMKKQEDLRKDLKFLIQATENIPSILPSLNNDLQKMLTISEDSKPSQNYLASNLADQQPKISLRMHQSEDDDMLDLSEMLAYTQDCVTPSEYTPMSTLDNQTTSVAWFNPDVSLDYSTLQIEYMADNFDQQQKAVSAVQTQEAKKTSDNKSVTPSRASSRHMSRVVKNFKQSNSNDIYRIMRSREFGNDQHAKTPKVATNNNHNLFASQRDQRLANYQANSMSINLPEVSLQQQTSNELTKENLRKLDNDTNENKSIDGTPKSQITRSVISGRDKLGKRKINQYIVLSELGKGSYAEVYLCVNEENKQRFAMKILNKRKLNKIFISKTRTALQDVEIEIAIMKKLNHPNVVSLIEVLDDPTHDKLYIIMEYLPNGSLMKKLSKTKNSNLQLMHECAGVIHRDIKPDNLLLDEQDRLKISDFGVSFLMENGSDEIATTAGSNYFFAPEVCQGSTFKGRKSDIWAAGVTLYQMVFKKYPFTSNNIPDLYNKIQSKEPDYPPDSNVSLVDLLHKMFIKDANDRISLDDIMKHDWVTSNGINPMPRTFYPKVELTQHDKQNLFKNVWVISKIKLKLKSQLQRRRQTIMQSKQETAAQLAQLQLQHQQNNQAN